MNHQLWPGGGAVITAGMMQGVFAVPMKFTSRWNYENIWLVYSLTGMIGRLLTFARIDDAILGSIDIALRKAKTSVLFNNPSESLWEYCKPGDPAPATEYTNGGLIPYAGGVPIRAVDGSLIGAIGVSDGMPLEDGEVASSTAHFRILQDPFQAPSVTRLFCHIDPAEIETIAELAQLRRVTRPRQAPGGKVVATRRKGRMTELLKGF